MRGIDTNVLVRYLTADDSVQFAAVAALIEGAEDTGETLFINVVVLCELCWVLRGRRYGYDRSAISEVVERILDARTFEVERRDLVRRALRGYRGGEGDFAGERSLPRRRSGAALPGPRRRESAAGHRSANAPGLQW